jgi:hypothetical protein
MLQLLALLNKPRSSERVLRLSLLSAIFCFTCFVSSHAAKPPRVQPPTPELQKTLTLSDFYKKSIVIDGLAIVASDQVADHALLEAAYLINQLLTGRDDLRAALVNQKIRVAIMAPTEMTTMIPEHSDLRPATYWDRRARGLGATRIRPAVSGGAENLLEYPGDPYRGENILIHEFSHAIHEFALRQVDKTFQTRLQAAYDQAKSEDLWTGTYAMTNPAEYWAEGVQSWFACNQKKDRQHTGINSREELRKHDPRLGELLAEVFKDNVWLYERPSQRKDKAHLADYDRTKAPRFAWPASLKETTDDNSKK